MARKIVGGTGLDCDYAALEERALMELLEAEENLAPGLHNPVRQRMLGLIEAYRPLARVHFPANPDLGLRKKNK